MAVNKITNKETINREGINRAQQMSMKDNKVRGNAEQTVLPGRDFTKGFAITLKDIDTSVMSHIKDVMKPRIKEANEIIKVPVLYGNEERWKAVRERGVLRDKNGSLILPLIMFKRTDVSFDDSMPMSFDHDVKGEFIKVVRSNRWSKDNRYDRFSVQQGIKPVQERLVTGMPDHVVCNYSIVMMTNYIEQMNVLSDMFLEHIGTYFGDSTKHKFLSSMDGGISDATEMNREGERLIKSEFSLSIKAYVIPEFTSNIFGTTSEITKELTTSKIVFGIEGDATDKQLGK
tara:strand:- start:417 stop:1280 length:864 start_codon:yes stop_codon:yes gene_type:complete